MWGSLLFWEGQKVESGGANVDKLLLVMQLSKVLPIVLGERFPHFWFLALKSLPEINR
jgi:hypothetical protein